MNYLREIRAAQRKHIALAERSRKSDGTVAFAVVGVGILGIAGYIAWKASRSGSSSSTTTNSSTTPNDGGWLQISPPGGMIPIGARFALMVPAPSVTSQMINQLSTFIGMSGNAAIALPGEAFPAGQGWPVADVVSSFRGMATNTSGVPMPVNPPAQAWIYVPA